jgi:hypothetical protein
MVLAALVNLAVRSAAAPVSPEVVSNMVAYEARFWRSCEKSADTVTSRQLFAYALGLGEAKEYPERFERLLDLADQMQDQDPQSKTYGNFWWTMNDGKVMDANAVDFCMRGGALLWLKDRDFVPPAAREHLEKILNRAVQGCLGHQVPTSYSNIAIMNAGDLILLGEGLNRPEVAAEGYARLDRVFQYTRTTGIHEFNSPTYTGVDLDGLGLIETYCQRDTGRAQARALLELWWTDVALNWFPPAQKLAGSQSRTYDYLHGLGDLDRNLMLNGWLAGKMSEDVDALFSMEGNWQPAAAIRDRANRFPRLVRESWGEHWWEARTHYLLPDITLSTAATSYGGRMDMPLTVDWPGARDSVRGYFIADGRNDPYGKITIAAGAHKKAFHLNPFWAGAQRTTDALGLVIYRDKDVATNSAGPTSDFVLPLAAEAIYMGDQRVTFVPGQSIRLAVSTGKSVTLRRGSAALGLRVPWTCGRDGRSAPAFLVYDGNAFGAVRLTVEHEGTTEAGHSKFKHVAGGAAFWLRVGSGLNSDRDFSRWRTDFAAAAASVKATGDGIQFQVTGTDGPVSVSAAAPWAAPTALEPAPTRAVLELNGADIGGPILGTLKLRGGRAGL